MSSRTGLCDAGIVQDFPTCINSSVPYRALVLTMSDEPERAIEDAMRALRLNPLDPTSYLPQMAVVVAHIRLRQYDEAVVWAHKAIESAPPRYPMSYAWLIVAECARGNAAAAEPQLGRLAAILPDEEIPQRRGARQAAHVSGEYPALAPDHGPVS